MLIFSTFKEPTDSTWNAVRSWLLLTPRILLFGEEARPYEAEFGVEVIEPLRKDNLPRLDSMFEMAQEHAEPDEVLVFVNADILLSPDVLAVKSMVHNQFAEYGYLVVGQRTDLVVEGRLDVGEGSTWSQLRERAKRQGKLLPPCGSDYFIFPSGFYQPPPFVIARFAYDNWLIYDALQRSKPVINATNMLLAIHQQHYENNAQRVDRLTTYNSMLVTRCYPNWDPWSGWVSHATIKL